MRRTVLGALIVIHVGLTACSSNRVEVVDTLTPEDYAIFNSLIHALFLDSATSRQYDLAWETEPQQIVIQSQVFGSEPAPDDPTRPRLPFPHRIDPSVEGYLLRKLPGVEVALVRQFILKNQKPIVIRNDFDLSVPVVLLAVDSLTAILETGDFGWHTFYLHYPRSQGFLELTRPAISDNETRALVYAGNHYAYGGSGWYFLLERVGDRWVIIGRALSWII